MTYHKAQINRLFLLGMLLVAVMFVQGVQFAIARPATRITEANLQAVLATVTQQAKLSAVDPDSNDEFGFSVAIDDDTAIIGAPYDGAGSAHIFAWSGSIWTQQAKLTAFDAGIGDEFGYSVAISGDTAIVGARYDNDGGSDSGSAYIFGRSGTDWFHWQKLTADDAADKDEFGFSVAIDGDTVVIGAHDDDDDGGASGSAYVFIRSGTTWTQQAKLTADDANNGDRFGYSVAISGDTAVVGARYDNYGVPDSGSAYVFIRSGTTWTQQAQLTADDRASNDYFGISVGISGETAVIGAFGDDDDGSASGSAYVFGRSGTTWAQQTKLTADDASDYDYFGYSVAISGNTAIIGAYGDDPGDDDFFGSAYVFNYDGMIWTQQAKLTADDAASGDAFGFSVGISGSRIVIGAHSDDLTNGSNGDEGSAYVFKLNEAPVITTNTGLTLDEGATLAVSTSDLQTTDADETAAELTYTITTTPINGTLNLATFTQADIDNGAVSYTHDDDDTISDSFDFSVTDSIHSPVTGTFNIIVTPVNDLPEIGSNNGLTLDEAGTGTIGNSTLAFTDDESGASTIIYTLITSPAYGTLKNNGLTLNDGEMFTQADIDADNLTYTHDGGETTGDSFVFSVSDEDGGTISNQTFDITVSPVNDPPEVVVNNLLTVSVNGTQNIRSNQLQTSDAESVDSNITYTVTSAPTQGTLSHTTFTQAQINAGNIVSYTAGGTATTDNFIFNVSDGTGETVSNQTFSITISANTIVPPVITTNTGITVEEGATGAIITQNMLETTDSDNTTSQLIYTLTDEPGNGTLQQNGGTLSTGNTFTQADINNNLLTYTHNGSETISDSFSFNVSDGLTTVGGIFSITVMPVSDAPQVAPTVGLTVNEGEEEAITSTQLLTTDVDNAAEEIVYTITSAPSNGTLHLQLTALGNGGQFTQAAINAGNVSYTHDGSIVVSDEFTFQVTDGTTTISNQSFNITIKLAQFYGCATVTTIPEADCNALVALYNTTNSANWTNSAGWLNAPDPCTWYGVTCGSGRVETLALRNNELSGSIPAQIGDLQGLLSLFLESNQLSGSIPAQIGNLTNLQNLRIDRNELSGSIPAQIGDLDNLMELQLFNNQLSGSIPAQIGGLDSLTTLDLSSNRLTGSIPAQIGDMTALQILTSSEAEGELDLSYNQLSGSIPAQIGDLENLRTLKLNHNQLSGSIPAQIGRHCQSNYTRPERQLVEWEHPGSDRQFGRTDRFEFGL